MIYVSLTTIPQRIKNIKESINSLINQTQNGGYKSILWDGTNDHGHYVSAGVYLYRIQAGNYTLAKKMVLLK